MNNFFKGKSWTSKLKLLFAEQLLSLMNQINTSVKGGLFNAQLANQIFVLCQQLKFSGQLLEQSHKSLCFPKIQDLVWNCVVPLHNTDMIGGWNS